MLCVLRVSDCGSVCVFISWTVRCVVYVVCCVFLVVALCVCVCVLYILDYAVCCVRCMFLFCSVCVFISWTVMCVVYVVCCVFLMLVLCVFISWTLMCVVYVLCCVFLMAVLCLCVCLYPGLCCALYMLCVSDGGSVCVCVCVCVLYILDCAVSASHRLYGGICKRFYNSIEC